MKGRKMQDGTACAHLKVYWTTQVAEGGATRGWWECATCRTHFLPETAVKPVKTAALDLFNYDVHAECPEGKAWVCEGALGTLKMEVQKLREI